MWWLIYPMKLNGKSRKSERPSRVMWCQKAGKDCAGAAVRVTCLRTRAPVQDAVARVAGREACVVCSVYRTVTPAQQWRHS